MFSAKSWQMIKDLGGLNSLAKLIKTDLNVYIIIERMVYLEHKTIFHGENNSLEVISWFDCLSWKHFGHFSINFFTTNISFIFY